eukprot:TRINITY_DN1557_c0_g1_i1.p1 TRINITY_DN1557_c0_g1~~TRINITY_DN1557_c0_g1_i1.p1  ORF type:complete len:936 (-),score=144.25 TRINITY_DN1557_c0_g1_i1:190-2958(-)
MARVVHPEELAQHVSEDDCWLVIDGNVYDITRFHHPGGRRRLLELAGGDATKLFDKNHYNSRDEKLTMIQGMLVGRLLNAPREMDVQRRASVQHLRGGFDHREAREDEHLWSTRCRGFLPVRDPRKHLDEPYNILTSLVSKIPSAMADGSFRQLVDRHADRLREVEGAIDGEGSVDVLERVHSLFAYIGKAYVHGAAENHGGKIVPAFLSGAWCKVSEKLSRQPTMDYSDCVLYNWERIDPGEGITPENIRMLNRFTGLLDEEWFFKTHVMIESEAMGVVCAIYDGMRALESNDMGKLLRALSWLEQALSHVANNCLKIMFERREEDGAFCDPSMFFHRFRPFVSTWKAIFEGRTDAAIELQGPSGAMSSILPLCDAFLEVRMSSERLGTLLAGFEKYMPEKHRALLARIRERPARSFIQVLRDRAEDNVTADTLTDHFNGCVRRLLDFRWRHLSFIEEYVLKPSGSNDAKGTGGTPAFTYLYQHIEDTKQAMFIEEVADGELSMESLSHAQVAPYEPIAQSSQDIWKVTAQAGLLPSRKPLANDTLPTEWQEAYELLDLLPASCVPPATFRRSFDGIVLPRDCNGLTEQEMQERGRALLAYLVAGWDAAGEPEPSPPSLQELFTQISTLLGRAPHLGVTDFVLYNWRFDSKWRCWPQLESMRHVRPLQRFLCIEEEDWFCGLHVTLAGEMGDVIGAIERCYGARDVDEQLAELQSLTRAIQKLVDVHFDAGVPKAIAGRRSAPSVHPAQLFNRLRRFLPRIPEIGLDTSTLHAVQVYCAPSIAQSCLLHVLGVPLGEQPHAMQKFRTWQESPNGDLPCAHREYMQQLRTRDSMRSQIERRVNDQQFGVHHLARLELAHNSCIDMMSRYFSRRRELVCMMCGENSLKEHIAQEHHLIQSARLRLCIERRDMADMKKRKLAVI